ncbi:MAG: efflux RND transporter periplasmic adaptor subunit, partial [Burkholderiaceae bacterium]
VDAVGSIAYNERDQAIVQARATGYVERLLVRATLDRVARGQALAELYVPDWVASQEEFLSLRNMQGHDLAGLVDGARQRMRQAGMSDAQIRLVETSGTVHPRITLTAPIGGVVVELNAREGMTVMPGATLFRINGLATVWANAAVPEAQAGLMRVGTRVEVRSAAIAGTVFKGRVQAILPQVDTATRTLNARVELANASPHHPQLVPGMFVSIELSTPAQSGLTVPTEAIIQTGRRSVVMLAEGDGRFRPVEVGIGTESNGRTEIRSGLRAGQKVVASGQFLIDSEASLRASATRLEGAPPQAAPSAPEHSGQGRIEAIGNEAVTLSHQPIPALGWGAMTMDFGVPPAGLPAGLKPGQPISFGFTMNPDGLPVLTRIEPRSASAASAAPVSRAGRAAPARSAAPGAKEAAR